MDDLESRILDKIKQDLNNRETHFLSETATPSANALRRKKENRIEDGYRQAFSLDSDRILHSRAYTRYIDKTQVFYLIQNDHILFKKRIIRIIFSGPEIGLLFKTIN